MSKELFLKEILGESGYEALCNTLNKSKELDDLIFMRSLMSWVDTMGRFGYDGDIPGQSTKILIKKENGGLQGYVEIEDKICNFSNKDESYVVAMLAVSLGADRPPLVNTPAIHKLGKSIDCIVKTEFVNKNVNYKKPPQKQLEAGPPAAPIPPDAPVPPQKDADDNKPELESQGKVVAETKEKSRVAKKEKKPRHKSFIFKLKKHELNAKCDSCGNYLFKNTEFIGCLCYDKDGINVIKNGQGIFIKFNKNNDLVLELMEIINNAE